VRAQDVGEQVVVAVPLPAVVERHQEQVGVLQAHEPAPAPRAAGDGVAQRPGESFEDRRLEQEAPDVLGQARQHLLGEVVDDVAVVAGEPRDERPDVVAAPHREGRELQGGDPALGAPVERRDVVLGERQAHRPVEVGGGLLLGEAQVGGPDLEQLTPRAPPRQGERRVDPGREHEVELLHAVLEQERDPVVHGRRRHEVEIIEDEQEVARHPADVVEQGHERGLG
jgi:hypothetical protein